MGLMDIVFHATVSLAKIYVKNEKKLNKGFYASSRFMYT